MTTIPAMSIQPAARVPLLRRVLRRPLGVLPLAILAIVGIVAVIGPWVAPYEANKSSLDLILSPPTAEHLLGTDSSGRDVLSRLLVSTQVTMAAALLALFTALTIGVISGLISGYYQGWFDGLANWATSLTMAIPGIVVLLAVRAAFGPSVWIAMVIFGILMAPGFHRLVYTAVTATREELYVDAARVSGLSDARIIGRHILTVVRPPVIIQTAFVAGGAIGIQSGLEFLGLGDITVPTWGSMLSDAFMSLYRQPLLMLWPSLAIGITTIACTLLGNALRDALDGGGAPRRSRRVAKKVATTSGPSVVGISESPEEQVTRGESVTIVHSGDLEGKVLAEKVLQVSDLRVGYSQEGGRLKEVVHGVSFDIRRGEVHGLVGESGSGKSQTAFAVLGLLPQGGRVTAGTIDYEGVVLSGASERTYRQIRGKRIGYIPQEPMSNLDPSFTIGSQLVEPLRLHLGLSRRVATERSLELLARVGIPNPRRTFAAYPFEISGGMAQRVLIAGAVSTEPDLIVADEPTTALDVTVQAEVLDLLRDLQSERQMAMLLVTHNFGVVADLCDQVTVMQHGLFVEQGPARAIFRNPRHPYTQALFDALLDGGPARSPLSIVGGLS
jgi:ABC-type dipeptide/oligopeptide/nickel transport system ATPase component/ABC-type dipeptide/oligopeptide/nickel transport system permease subunit